jgi:hypothetical protein
VLYAVFYAFIKSFPVRITIPIAGIIHTIPLIIISFESVNEFLNSTKNPILIDIWKSTDIIMLNFVSLKTHARMIDADIVKIKKPIMKNSPFL